MFDLHQTQVELNEIYYCNYNRQSITAPTKEDKQKSADEQESHDLAANPEEVNFSGTKPTDRCSNQNAC